MKRLLAIMSCLTLLTVANQAAPESIRPQPGSIPVIYCTDLFHPHDDPDDHFDLAVIFTLKELDLKGIVLDQGAKQEQRPGQIPVSQLNRLTGRNVPAYIGLAQKLKNPNDQGRDQESRYQGAVDFILNTLRESSSPVMFAAVGSMRDLVAAFNREPELFRAKVGKVLVFIGEASDPKFQEYNVELDPHAYVGLLRSGLPVYWVPCFDGGLWQNKGHASFWQAKHASLLQNAVPELVQYFIYALERETSDPLKYLAAPADPERKARLLAGTRNLWCTAVFGALADQTVAWDHGKYRLLNAGECQAGDANSPQALFGFKSVELRVSDDGVVQYHSAPDSRRVQRFEIRQPDRYAEGMTAVTADLLSRIRMVP